MHNSIYYFSGTGNSLAFARQLAGELGDTELRAISQVFATPIPAAPADRVGFVFPVYVWGLPRIVADFVKQLQVKREQYIFAVATCGGTPGGTLLQLQKLLRKNGGRLAAGFVVRAAGHTLYNKEMPIIALVRNLNKKPMPLYGHERIAEIISVIQQRQQYAPETSSTAANVVGGLIYKAGIKSLTKADRDYWVDDNCTHCGICARICPRGNIAIEKQQVIWRHDCEQCLACLQWCPQAAIQYRQDSRTKPRSHHPDVTVQEMLVR